MPKNFSRRDRVADVVHRIVARTLREEFRDPRVGMITVSSVDVSPDMKHAKIYVTVLEDQKAAESIRILNLASGFFRSQLAASLQLRVIPKPQFVFDASVVRGNRITSLLESCIAKA